jgi:hypothetical protein
MPLAGGENGFQGQRTRVGRLTMFEILRFADADDGNLVTESSIVHPRTKQALASPFGLSSDRDDIAKWLQLRR